MNMKKITWFGLVLLLCAISTQVFAGPYGNPPRGPSGGSGKQWHKSHSGKIDTPREQKAFGKYDKNDDGKLGPKEHKYMDLDENRDGKIQPVEKKYDATHPNETDGPRDAQWQKSHSGQIDNHNGAGNHPKPPIKDVNADGTIDDTDRKIMIKSHVNNPNEAKMDTNNDHHVSKEELDAAKEIKSGDSETESTSE